MERLRTLFFVVALALIGLVVLAEIGALGVLRGVEQQATAMGALIPQDGEVRDAYDDLDDDELNRILAQDKPPGLAVPYLALVDAVLLFTVALMGVGLLIGERIHARVQGVATLLFSILLILAAIGLILAALIELLLMVAMFLAVPFGTLAYLVIYGFFNRTGAIAALGLLMTLKLGFSICLALAHQRFLQNKGLVLMIITSFVGNIIISFLHGIVPGFLVSITDAIAAIVAGILAVLWAIFLLVGSVISVVKALRVDRA